MRTTALRNCISFGVGCLCAVGLVAPAMAGDLSVVGNLSVASNLTANVVTLRGATDLTSPVLDFSQPGLFYRYTLTTNTTWAFTNHVAGRQVWLQVTQDGTGGRQNLWPANLLWPDAEPPTVSTDPNTFSVFKILDNGTHWLAQPEGLNYVIAGAPCTGSCVYALQFEGNGSYVSTPGSDDFFPPDMTIEFWVDATYFPDWPNYFEILSYLSSDCSAGWAINIRRDWCQFGTTDGGAVNLAPWFENGWHHVAICYSRTNGAPPIGWIDGVTPDMGQYGSGGTVPNAQAVPLLMGKYPNLDTCGGYPGAAMYHHGPVDEFRLSKTIRYTTNSPPAPDYCFTNDTDTVVLWKFDDGPGCLTTTDSSNNGHTGTLHGSPRPAWVDGLSCTGPQSFMAQRSSSSLNQATTSSRLNTTNVFNATTSGTNNVLRLQNLPTSSSGLPSSALWNDAGTLKIVP